MAILKSHHKDSVPYRTIEVFLQKNTLFNMLKVKVANTLPLLTTDVNDKVIVPKDTCTTQGKIYFYCKAGAVETVYFSRNKDCMTLSFIKTGEKYFTKMSNKARGLLDSLEKNVTVLPGRIE